MVRRAQRGYSLLEIVVALAVFGIFLMILVTLTAQMRYHEKSLPVNMHKHPMVIAVLARVRRDVLDAYFAEPYLESHDGYVSSPKVLIVQTIGASGGLEKIVWDFRTEGEARRIAYTVGNAEEWVARGLPAQFTVSAVQTFEGAPWSARITAKDKEGRLAIDTILQPRATE